MVQGSQFAVELSYAEFSSNGRVSCWRNSRNIVTMIGGITRSADWPEGISLGSPLRRTGFNSAVKLSLDRADEDIGCWRMHCARAENIVIFLIYHCTTTFFVLCYWKLSAVHVKGGQDEVPTIFRVTPWGLSEMIASTRVCRCCSRAIDRILWTQKTLMTSQ